MSTLIKQLQKKYDFIKVDNTVLKGYSSSIILENYVLEIEETDELEPLRIDLNQTHEKNNPCDFFKVSVLNLGMSDEPYELFITDKYSKVDNFISAILE